MIPSLLPPHIYNTTTPLCFVPPFPSALPPFFPPPPPPIRTILSAPSLSPWLPPISHALALCSIGLISGMLLLLPFLALALMASSSASASSSSDQSSSCCRLPLEPLMEPLKSWPVRNLLRKVSKERLLLRCCFSKVSCTSSGALLSSTKSLSTERNSRGTSWTSGSICDTSLLNLQSERVGGRRLLKIARSKLIYLAVNTKQVRKWKMNSGADGCGCKGGGAITTKWAGSGIPSYTYDRTLKCAGRWIPSKIVYCNFAVYSIVSYSILYYLQYFI